MTSRLPAAALALALAATGLACGNQDAAPVDMTPPSSAGTADAKPPAGGAPGATSGKPDSGSPLPANAPMSAPTQSGGTQTHNGELAQGDQTLNSGEFSDAYSVDIQAGQSLVVDMRSTSDLDPYLIVRPPNPQEGEQQDNDDFEGDARHSRVEIQSPRPGLWTVLATSYQSGETGSYTLTIGTDASGGGGVSGTGKPKGK